MMIRVCDVCGRPARDSGDARAATIRLVSEESDRDVFISAPLRRRVDFAHFENVDLCTEHQIEALEALAAKMRNEARTEAEE